MLGKLIKYDLKAGSGIIIPTYIFIILCALFSRVITAISGISGGNIKHVCSFLFWVSEFILILSIIVVCVITLVWVVLRYRNNLLRDEGYLMHTLPVSPANLYFSKIITAMLFFIMDVIVTFFSIILSGMPAKYGIDWTYIKNVMLTFNYGAKQYNINGNIYIPAVIILVIAALYLSVSQLFASLNIGYGLNTRKGASRDLISVAAYIIIYIFMQIIMVIAVAVSLFIYGFNMENDIEILKYTQNLLIASIFIIAFFSAIYNFISIRLMQKKLNLE